MVDVRDNSGLKSIDEFMLMYVERSVVARCVQMNQPEKISSMIERCSYQSG